MCQIMLVKLRNVTFREYVFNCFRVVTRGQDRHSFATSLRTLQKAFQQLPLKFCLKLCPVSLSVHVRYDILLNDKIFKNEYS
jgi:hypothetical protein